jgi:hypothetical protein
VYNLQYVGHDLFYFHQINLNNYKYVFEIQFSKYTVSEVRFYFEISVRVYRNTWRHIPEKSYVIITSEAADAKHRQAWRS